MTLPSDGLNSDRSIYFGSFLGDGASIAIDREIKYQFLID